jgi:hypothetical protein
MKKLSWFFLLAIIGFACQDQEITPSKDASALSDNSSARLAGATPGAYTYEATSSDGKTWTIVIDQSAAQDISHINFAGSFCDGSSITAGNVTGVTVNGQDWTGSLAGSTGNGDVCGPTNLKLDNFGFNGGVITIVITFDKSVSEASFQIKSAQNCFEGYTFSHDCTPPPTCYQEETAWANGPRYISRGNWATYTPYQSTDPVNVYAGQNMHAGTATMSEVSDGNVTITIALNEGWSFQDVGEPVKIQGYSVAPSGNPSPGRFATKSSSLSVTVPAANYYGIHLDVQKAIQCAD